MHPQLGEVAQGVQHGAVHGLLQQALADRAPGSLCT